MKAASLAKVLQELEDEGLVVKVTVDDDGRLMEVAPTPAGRTLATLVTQDISDLFERVFWRKIPRSELGNLEQGIVDFLEHIGVDTNKIARESASVMSPQFLHSPYQTVRRWKRELEGEPVAFAEYRVLLLMRAQRGVVPSDAARQLCLKRSQVSLILKSLVGKGLARKVLPNEGEDARLRRYGVTGKGSQLAERLDRKLEAVTEITYASTSGRDAGMLNAWHMRMYFDLMESVQE